MIGYPSERLFEEVAYIAYHFHWSLDEIFSLEHRSRVRWVREISRINQELGNGGKEYGVSKWQ